jgi:hypothetical protein
MNFEEYGKQKQGIVKKLSCMKKIIDQPKLSSEFDFKNYSKKISADIEYLENEEHRIVVVGSYGAGKTTFMKALLGFKHLPASHGENTAALAYFRKANSKNTDRTITIKLTEGTTFELSAIEKIHLFINTPGKETEQRLSEVKKYVSREIFDYYSELGGFDPALHVAAVNVWLDDPLLNNNVVLIDSPGVGSISQKHEAITKEEVSRADAVIYLFNSNQLGLRVDEKMIYYILDNTNNIIFSINRKDEAEKDLGHTQSWDETIEKLKHNFEESSMVGDYRFPEVIPFSAQYAWISISKDKRLFDSENNELEKLGKQPYRDFVELLEASCFNSIKEKIEEISTSVSKGKSGKRQQKIDGYESSSNKISKSILQILETEYELLKNYDDIDFEEDIKTYRRKIESLNDRPQKITDKLSLEKIELCRMWFEEKEPHYRNTISEALNSLNIENVQNLNTVTEVSAQLEKHINKSMHASHEKIRNEIIEIGRELISDYSFEGLSHEKELVDIPVYDYDSETVQNISREIDDLQSSYDEIQQTKNEEESDLDFNSKETKRINGQIDQAMKMMEDVKKMQRRLGSRPKGIIRHYQTPIEGKSEILYGFIRSEDIIVGYKEWDELDDTPGKAWDDNFKQLQGDIKYYLETKQDQSNKLSEYDDINRRIQKFINEENKKLETLKLEINRKIIERDLIDEDARERAFTKLMTELRTTSLGKFNKWASKFNPGVIGESIKHQFRFLSELEQEIKKNQQDVYEREIKELARKMDLKTGDIKKRIEFLLDTIGDLYKC